MAKTIARLMKETDDTDQSIIDIYVAIQSREFVQALQLSRHPSISSTPLAQALGALALSYIGRRAEAIAQAQKVGASGRVTDIKVLSVIAEVFNRSGMYMEKRILYEGACSRMPESVELQVELFFCYLHDEDYDKQKTLAMKLFKAGHNMFGTWAATVRVARALPSACFPVVFLPIVGDPCGALSLCVVLAHVAATRQSAATATLCAPHIPAQGAKPDWLVASTTW